MGLPQETPRLNFFTIFLKFTGFWYGHHGGTRWLYWVQNARMALYFGAVLIWDYLMALEDPREFQKKPYNPVTLWCNLFLIGMGMYYPRSENMEEWTRRMSQLLVKRREPWQEEKFRRLTSLWKYAVWLAVTQAFFAAFVTSFISILGDLPVYLFTDSPHPFYIPMALEGLLADKSTRSFTLYFLEFLNGVLLITPVLYYSGLLALFAASVLYISFELEMCTMKLKEWSGPHRTPLERKVFLKAIVDDHNEILRLTKLLERTIAPSLMISNGVASIIIGNFLYLAKRALKENDVGIMATQLYLACIATINTFIPCYIGQLLHNQGEKFCRSLTELDWDDIPPGMRMELKMILMQAQKPMVIDFKFNMPLNYVTFSDMMNKAYSLFIIFDSVDKQQE